MKKTEILNNYNLNLDDDSDLNYSGLESFLIDYQIATPDEIELVTNINGHNVRALLDIIYCRCGLRSIEQLVNEYSDNE